MEGRTVFQIAALDIECCVESAHTQNLGLTALHLKYVTCHDTLTVFLCVERMRKVN